MRVLHLSADYPDPVRSAKTRAIRNLLQLAPQHDHRVYSLNRVSWRTNPTSQTFDDSVGDNHRAVQYPALPKGLLHRHYLGQLSRWIQDDIIATGFHPDAVHAHKLTVEGIVGQQLAQTFGIPLIISVQGNTDLKIARAKPGLRGCLSDIWQNADIALPFAPWAQDALDDLLGMRTRKTYPLPCPGPSDQIIAPTSAPPVIRTAFHLHDYRNKNALRLIRAVGLAAKQVPNLLLEVIGGGDDVALTRLKRQGERYARGHVRFRGAVPHARMQALLNTSAAFALVSHRESFGMVFAEALLAGTPCLIPIGRAIDGYLPAGEVTLSAMPTDTNGIAASLVRLIREQQAFKARLKAYQEQGKLDFLRQHSISEIYAAALDQSLSVYSAQTKSEPTKSDLVNSPNAQPA